MPFGHLAIWQVPAQLPLPGGSVRVPGTALSAVATASAQRALAVELSVVFEPKGSDC